MSYDEDRRKGYTFLARMMQLGLIDEQITIFGINRLNLVNNFKGAQYLPRINDSEKLSELYKSSRCFLFTSEDENQSNIIAESMLNGCPVVAFDVGGNSELIQHKVNGYLAEPYSIIDLVRGLKWVLQSKEYLALSQNCILSAREKTSPELVSQNYLNVFKSFDGDINVD
jgi:glycosyltransferase involved in cell wall biosynthesis